MTTLTAALVITTKDRREDLRKALRSAMEQRPPVEVLVIDDGSSDGTADMVRQEFPAVRVERSATSRGYICQRNAAARSATTDIIVSMDDDAVLSSPGIVAAALRAFDDPRIGAVGIPFVNVNTSPTVLQLAPDAERAWAIDHFTGTAYAVRRELFLALGGFREVLVHQGEERDYCLRMLEEGRFVRLSSSEPILHYESPRRDRRRQDYYGSRNLVVFTWLNVPWPYFPAHLVATVVKGALHGLRILRPGWILRGLGAGLLWIPTHLRARAPVRRRTYALARRLRREGVVDLATLDGAERGG